MNWITDDIAIGDYFEARDRAALAAAKVRSVLSLVDTLKGVTAAELGVEHVCTVPLIDGPGNDRRQFREAVETLAMLVELAPPVLVHCRAGRSRSPAVVAGYLMRKQMVEADEAIALVAGKRDIFVVPELVPLLEVFEQE
jgi:protein-tyrosine phosphatase